MKEKIKEAVSFHTEGHYEKAEEIYNEILDVQPLQPDANHNLGVLKVFNHNAKEALPHLEKAIKSNHNIEQYWLSYINALININEIELARKVITNASNKNFSGQRLNHLSKRLLLPSERFANNEFYQAEDGHYLDFLRILHKKQYEIYFEIGSRTGDSLFFSNSPSIAIDPFFQLKKDPLNNKEFCLLFQETSEIFFEKTYRKFNNFKCQLGFIDGMHLFEYALKDFINLAKISSKSSLFLFHDVLPWSFEMATRDYNKIPRGKAWTGDVWKLIPILIDVGLVNNMKLLSTAPSGILAILNPEKTIIYELENNFTDICNKWFDIQLDKSQLLNLYQTNIFEKPESYITLLQNIHFGKNPKDNEKNWVSH